MFVRGLIDVGTLGAICGPIECGEINRSREAAGLIKVVRNMVEKLILIIQCAAPEGLFEGKFEDLSSEHQKLFEGVANRVCCDSGTLGHWCLDCRFGDVEEEQEISFGR